MRLENMVSFKVIFGVGGIFGSCVNCGSIMKSWVGYMGK